MQHGKDYVRMCDCPNPATQMPGIHFDQDVEQGTISVDVQLVPRCRRCGKEWQEKETQSTPSPSRKKKQQAE